MSQVFPVPMGIIGGLLVMIGGMQLGATEPVVWALWAGSTLVISVGWAVSNRLPNGGGGM